MLHALQDALRASMASGLSPEVWAALERASEAYDRYIAIVVAAHPMSCGRGCSACCHDNPHGVAAIEVERLSRRLAKEGRTDSVRPVARAAAAAWADAVARSGPDAAMRGQRALRRPCPLLGADGACTVYSDRPVACRMFHALTPAEWCSPEHARFEERVNPHLLPPRPILALLDAVGRAADLDRPGTLWEGLDRVLSRNCG